MKITILCDNIYSWIVPYALQIKGELERKGHKVFYVNECKDIQKGDMAFFLGCEKIISKRYLELNEHNLVVHESDLPKGKGWSPLTWQILEGRNDIKVTLFEASEKVDSGNIYIQKVMQFGGTELLKELKYKQGMVTKEIVIEYVDNFNKLIGQKQKGEETFYRMRTPRDSKLDIDKSIKEQFNLLRVVDNERYPAFFIYKGKKYIIKIYEDDKR